MELSHVLGVAAVGLLAAVWGVVQGAWRRTFPEACCSDPDVLAGRMGCGGANCKKDCGRGPGEQTGSAAEEDR